MAENVERQLWTFPNCNYTCVKKARYIFVGLLRQYTEDLKYNDCNVTEKKICTGLIKSFLTIQPYIK